MEIYECTDLLILRYKEIPLWLPRQLTQHLVSLGLL